MAHTSLAVLKLESYAIEQGLSPFDPNYAYHENVEDGLDYIFANLQIEDIDPQHGGIDDPDTNGNGVGICWNKGNSHETYITGIALMAIAACNAPDRTVTAAGSLKGKRYDEVAQDMVDYLAWSQTDSGTGRGGWDYAYHDDSGNRADNSISGWAVLGLGYAGAAAPFGFGLTIPDFVRDELNIWIDYIQCDSNGGSGYDSSCSWVNTLKTGNLLYEMEFVGDGASTARVQDAVAYLQTNWNAAPDPGWKRDPQSSHYQAMYTMMKGLEVLGIDTIGGSIDWYNDFADELVAEQNADGSWSGCPYYCSGTSCNTATSILCTVWALLTLEKAVPPSWLTLTPVADTNPVGSIHTLMATLNVMGG